MKRLVMMVLMLALMSGSVWAADTKIGYLDMQRALNTSETGKAAKAQLQEKLKKYQEQINSKQEELQKLKNDLEKQGLALTEASRAAKEKDYQQKLKDFQRFTKDAEEDLQARDGEFTKKILEVLEKIVQEYGKKNGYSVIFDARSAGMLYADTSVDLTDEILKALNAAQSKK
ncbi:OmpH family outer membrane protein [Trichlorobacter lovleyi]|uniref:Outer membrane chaperone Skp (OmpH) n=1 Tax=Trichlorobacter lovleyi (strain ATCC BAA-1151 / DSM 17278 / SZ) TaxID=398767 RepID=B3E4H2_TRIL1|nr:OmpH family outer membrane protein [Trichlorobacter lovleyi]ACD94487.1 outer membrane chaperone Skp (OmpH) [Trichlorobacter lovleyi SZ]